jgi:serine/threonine protein kinase/tetratricopeptide (TPR) repeat protein
MECPKCHFKNPDNTRYCGHCATPLLTADETLDAHTATLSTPMPDIMRGSVLSDRYEIIEEIGKGGMGKVYKAYDRDIDENIALKIIRPEIASNAKIIERFQNELKTARKIAHRNVCKMFDVGRDGGTRFITMEYVPGEDLKKSIRRIGPLTVRKTISIGKQVCHGLSEAHRLGVYHRDLKPHNIMIDREGNVRIMDFGIALSQDAKSITDSHIMIGTPQYLSPEQVEGKRVDQRSDIYSLGVILFEMVTGQVPFEGDTTLSIAVKHKIEAPRDPREFNAQIPEELSSLILRCMEKNPERRYQTAEELNSELSQIETELPTTETPLSKEKTVFKPIRMNSKLFRFLRALLLFVLLIGAGYLFYTQILKKETHATEEAGITKWKESVLVLPIRDLSSGEGQEALLGLVLTDNLIHSLNAFDELRLLPLSTSIAYQDSNKDILTICKELNVSKVLEGTILRTGEYLNINLTLSSVAVGAIVWANSFKGPIEMSLDIQEDITKSIARALGIKDVDVRYPIITAKIPPDSMADEYRTKGRYFELSYYNNPNEMDFENCVQSYLKVIEANPDDLKTYWRLGNIHEARFIDTNMDQRYLDLMFHYFQKAYEVDPNAAESNMGIGWSFFYKKDNDKAYQFMKRAYELKPDNAEINHLIGAFFRSIGLYDRALSYYSKALELDPKPLEFDLWYEVLADCYSMLGQFEEAATISGKALEIQLSSSLYMRSAWQSIMLRQYREANHQLIEAEKLAPDSSSARLYRGLLFAAQENRTKALELISKDDKAYRYPITSIYSLLGMRDEAIRNIQLGIDVGFAERGMYFYSYSYLLSNPCYDNLRDDPRFQKILQNEKVKYEEKARKYKDFSSVKDRSST